MEAVSDVNDGEKLCDSNPLTSNQKQSIFLVQIGNFLEHFDLFLYIHMAIVLNAVFFPKTDPFVTSLLAALAFSSNYLLRPLGALFFGYLGDKYGRKSTVIITSFIMAFCSFMIGSLPSYQAIGMYASFILIIIRMLQGFSAIGEVTGARVYLSELIAPPKSYLYTGLIDASGGLGSLMALCVGAFSLAFSEGSWRTAFYFGSAIAVVGSVARMKLRETPDFLKEKKIVRKDVKLKDFLYLSVTHKRQFLCYLGVQCLYPICLYLTYIYLGEILISKHGFKPVDVINHNILVGIVEVTSSISFAVLAMKFNPINTMRLRLSMLMLLLPFVPYIIERSGSLLLIYIVQCSLVVLGRSCGPAHSLFLNCFPVIGRYTQATLVAAFSGTAMYLVTAYGCVFLGAEFGFTGIATVIMLFAMIAMFSATKFYNMFKLMGQSCKS